MVQAKAGIVLMSFGVAAAVARAQEPPPRPVVTAADYARAEQFLPGNAARLLTGVPVWPGDLGRRLRPVLVPRANR